MSARCAHGFAPLHEESAPGKRGANPGIPLDRHGLATDRVPEVKGTSALDDDRVVEQQVPTPAPREVRDVPAHLPEAPTREARRATVHGART
ncbi:hypothetical protein [Halosaccharopolyspora lacisalsi]|uniref:hypothetical protein n=1 Tax=Halosaccharopolyspora lacisalsi TaxID=1000566 RepID=UPI0015FBC869|nr:hypothetical protein [Halosaccharopolyspora lacisalsi]